MSYYQDQYESGSHFSSGSSLTWAVQRLMIINIVVFAIQLILGIRFGTPISNSEISAPGGNAIAWLCFFPSEFPGWHIYRVVTYQFLHSGLMHLFSNMLCLYFFGPDVERVVGTRRFYFFYLCCGAIGVLGTMVPYMLSHKMTSVMGASGAVLGVLVAFAVLDPERRVYLFLFPFPINARGLVLILIVMQVFYAMGEGISVATHFGGMATGFVLIKLLPLYNDWQVSRRREKALKPKRGKDPIGDAVDNIFDFDNKKKR